MTETISSADAELRHPSRFAAAARDLRQSPAVAILYPARGMVRWNPLTPLVDATRGWRIGGRADSRFLLVSALTIPLLLAAWLFVRLARPQVVGRLG